MAYIYKITNIVSGKSYIGQTIMSIQDRMNKHYSHAKVATTGTDYAIQKYGRENFKVEQICECAEANLDDLERYYIQYYDTYNNGYNLTIGGQDVSTKLFLDEAQIVSDYLDGMKIIDIATKNNCCDKIISNILHKHSVEIRKTNATSFQKNENTAAIKLCELGLSFNSIVQCGQWLIDKQYSKASTPEIAGRGISRVLSGLRHTYCGFHFEYI